jgi:hypothetical protein
MFDYQHTIGTELGIANLRSLFAKTLADVKTRTKGEGKITELKFEETGLANWPHILRQHEAEVRQLLLRYYSILLSLRKYRPTEAEKIEDLTPKPVGPTLTKHQEDLARLLSSAPDLENPRVNPVATDLVTLFSLHRLLRFPATPAVRRKQKRAFGLLIGVGVAAAMGTVGTVFGGSNKAEIDVIKSAIKTEIERTNQLIEINKVMSSDIDSLRDVAYDTMARMVLDQVFDTGLLVSKLRTQVSRLRDQVVRFEGLIQQAQNHKLSSSFLTSVELKQLFRQLQKSAAGMGFELLIDHPTDIFQLETLFAYDGITVQLLVKVPTAPPDNRMRLYRLHPFPLPFADNNLIIPDVHQDILGITDTEPRLTLTMSLTELLACTKINTYYLCPRNGALNRYPEDHCLGALYYMLYDQAQQICPFRIEKSREVVYQLMDNWFLAYSKTAMAIPLRCSNKSVSELHLKKGISKFHLTAGCIAEFPRYHVISDYSILLPQTHVQLEMEWDPENLVPNLENMAIPELRKLQDVGASQVMLSTLQSIVAAKIDDTPSFFHHIHFAFNILTIIILLLTILYGIYRLWSRSRANRQESLNNAVTLQVRNMLEADSTTDYPLIPPHPTHHSFAGTAYQPPGKSTLV